MMIPFTNKHQPSYISFVYGSGWDKGSFKMIEFRKTPLGWDFNVWRFIVSYDNYKNCKKVN